MNRWLMPLLAAVVLIVGAAASVSAAELVMIDSRACSYCAKFKREIMPGYAGTPAGLVAPLRLVSPLRKWPADLRGVKQTPFAPVFILVDNGREVGRFFGYASAQTFWAKLNPLISDL